MASSMLGGPVPPIKYKVYDDRARTLLGECPAIEVSGDGIVTLALKDFVWAKGVAEPPPATAVELLSPALDMFDDIRRELSQRGWQPDTAEAIAADMAKTYLNDILKAEK